MEAHEEVTVWASADRPQKPTALRVLHGDLPDRIDMDEPLHTERDISIADTLSDDARSVWERLAPDLIGCGVLMAL